MNLRELVAATPRYRLAHLPTPIEPMSRLSDELGGPRLWVKRDDLTGLGLGGNKVRKLEFVLPDAIANEADVLVTAGVAQSNSVRQIAAGAAKAGIDCYVVEFTDRPGAAVSGANPTGNAMLIRLFGATVTQVGWTGDRNARHAGGPRRGAVLAVVPSDAGAFARDLAISVAGVHIWARIR